MNITCSGSYVKDREALDLIFDKYGYTSPSAERELICLAQTGNTAALKSYADLLFYHKIRCRNNYRKAFPLYLKAADLSFSGGTLTSGGNGNPHAYFPIAYYLTHYKNESVLRNCETIEEIEAISPEERKSLALDLATASLDYCESPAAINLIARLKGDDDYFEQSAEAGYVYACNNLAAREADMIVDGVDDIDTMLFPIAGCGCRGNGNTALLFLLHPVHGGFTVVRFTDFVVHAGIVQNAFGRCGFARVNMGHDADIALHVQSYGARHRHFSYKVGISTHMPKLARSCKTKGTTTNENARTPCWHQPCDGCLHVSSQHHHGHCRHQGIHRKAWPSYPFRRANGRN